MSNANVAAGPAPARLSVTYPGGSLELLKYVGLVAMVGDHVNKYLLGRDAPWLYDAGRVAAPLFLFVFAYNLARRDDLEYFLMIGRRLLMAAVLAAIPYTYAAPSFLPQNILFSFAGLLVYIALLVRGQRVAATAALLILPTLTEYAHPLMLGGAFVWAWAKTGSRLALGAAIGACVALTPINNNAWALCAVPLIIVAYRVPLALRNKWLFYVFYPAHLYFIVLFDTAYNFVKVGKL